VRYVFGGYALDIERRELKRGAELVSVGPQVFDLLAYLVQNSERVVSKSDLLNAVWRGRIVSESTLTSHINLARKAVGDRGADQQVIRTIARKGFRFVGRLASEPSSVGAQSAPDPNRAGGPDGAILPFRDKPSIAVLPFDNLSGDPGQDYFADGMVEEVITELSRMAWLFVIARNSSFVYKGRPVEAKQVGRELGVRYLLEGSVRKEGARMRIIAQLIDTVTGAHLWAERFEGTLDRVFELQDQVAAAVVGAISPRLEWAEIQRAKRKPTESLDAYDYFLRGMASFYLRSQATTADALRLFHRAIDLDDEFASAYGMAAWCYVWRLYNGWMTDSVEEERIKGARLARRAVELGSNDAIALSRGGYALSVLAGESDSGAAFLDRALQLNPNLAATWALSGLLRNWMGEPELGIDHLARAMRLSPQDPTLYHMQTGTGFAHLLAGRFDEACGWAERALRDEPGWSTALTVAAAAHALAGRNDKAQRRMAQLRQANPALRVSSFTPRLLRRPEHLALWKDGLRRAGLPE
jgi:TolB-like protein